MTGVVLRPREVANDRRRKLEDWKASDRADSARGRNPWDGPSQSDLSEPESAFRRRKRLASLIAVSLIARALWAPIWMAVGLRVAAAPVPLHARQVVGGRLSGIVAMRQTRS